MERGAVELFSDLSLMAEALSKYSFLVSKPNSSITFFTKTPSASEEIRNTASGRDVSKLMLGPYFSFIEYFFFHNCNPNA